MNDTTKIGNITGSQAVAIDDGAAANYTVNYYQQITPHPVAPDKLSSALELLAQLPLETIPPVMDLPAGSYLPHARNTHFVGREDELRKLAQYFKSTSGTVSVSQAAAATGMGGIGKSQLAVAFAHRYGCYFQGGVYWISMANPGAVPTEIVNRAGQMDGLGVDFPTLDYSTPLIIP